MPSTCSSCGTAIQRTTPSIQCSRCGLLHQCNCVNWSSAAKTTLFDCCSTKIAPTPPKTPAINSSASAGNTVSAKRVISPPSLEKHPAQKQHCPLKPFRFATSISSPYPSSPLRLTTSSIFFAETNTFDSTPVSLTSISTSASTSTMSNSEFFAAFQAFLVNYNRDSEANKVFQDEQRASIKKIKDIKEGVQNVEAELAAIQSDVRTVH